MNKLIKAIIGFSLRNKPIVFLMTFIIVFWGIWSFKNTPLDAFPDVTNTQVIVITQWAGKSAEEVERYVTIPIEVALNPVQNKTSLRSVTMFGLNVTTLNFEDGVNDFVARQQVYNLLSDAALPDGVTPEVQPPYGPTGEIYRYTLKSPDKSSVELLTLQNWVIERAIRSVPGVADVYAFGGAVRIYEITVDPLILAKYNITALDVYDAVSKSNINVGGDILNKNGEAYVVRGIGLLKSISDIENIVVDNINGIPITIKNLGKVSASNLPRLGQAGLDSSSNDIVCATIVMRKGENPREVVERVKKKLRELNTKVLPPDVRIVPFYDRSDLMDFCTHTILHNLIEGILLVTLVVSIFMFNWRTTLIVAMIIPLALLFAFICLHLRGMTANLLSMGAIDFGIIMDGAVVMVEGIFVVLAGMCEHLGPEKYAKIAKLSTIKKTGSNLAKSIFSAKIIIILALVPIFSFEKVEGKMFSPLAWTLSFALLGALLFTLTLVPVMASILLKDKVVEKNNPVVNFFDNIVMRGLGYSLRNKFKILSLAFVIMVLSIYSFKYLGSEFLPSLNEGALWMTTEAPRAYSLDASRELNDKIRRELKRFPEVRHIISLIGRSNDGTDPNSFNFTQFSIDLYPQDQWKRHITRDSLINEMTKVINEYPGLVLNFSQPISDNVAEAVAGFKGNFGLKIYGSDLNALDHLADSAYHIIKEVRGVKDIGIIRNLGQPEVSIILNENKMAIYGITAADANAVIEMAIGGKSASIFYDLEKRFDIRIRYPKEYRNNETVIGNLLVPTLHGAKIPLKEIADIKTVSSPSFIFRDDNKRYIAIKFSIRDRDMGSTIAEAQDKVATAIPANNTNSMVWCGEFENQQRAEKKLKQVVPIVLVLIFLFLFITFGTLLDAGLVMLNVPFAIIGGILSLHITGTIFSISAGIGFIALFGICIQDGVILLSIFKQNMDTKMPLEEAIVSGVKARVRPVVMTALMASTGLLPAAISHGIGSESQKPLAIVVIGGLISSTILTLLIFPVIVKLIYGRKRKNNN
ncbi:MAG: CusA/CzcA family heavy metal efflux RND transporter [Phycisphaerales bacterium]|nr:CusA/CzcA family heavy metal efflux RND transporter [Phycisphaerales bacterium]